MNSIAIFIIISAIDAAVCAFCVRQQIYDLAAFFFCMELLQIGLMICYAIKHERTTP